MLLSSERTLRRRSALTASHTVPADTLISRALPRIDYADTYTIDVYSADPPSVVALALAVFGTTPGWVQRLLELRNAIVAPLGLKVEQPREVVAGRYEPGDRLDIFEVFDRTEDELLLGGNDRHLDFRVGVLRRPIPDGVRVSVTTTVQFHNWFGRLYFLPVQPFHTLIVRQAVRDAERRLAAGAMPGTGR